MKIKKNNYIVIILFLLLIPTFTSAGVITNISQTDIGSATIHESTVLITGFEPFGKYEINPSQLIAETLNGQYIEGAEVVGIVLPVDFDESIEVVTQAIGHYNPVLVICTGLSARTQTIDVEKCGLNLKRLPRNASLWRLPRRIDPYGPFLRLSTISTRVIVKEMRTFDIPARQSIFAGMYVCNAVLYSMLGYIDEHNHSIPAGFIHVPLLSSQDPDGMDLETMVEAVTIAIETSL